MRRSVIGVGGRRGVGDACERADRVASRDFRAHRIRKVIRLGKLGLPITPRDMEQVISVKEPLVRIKGARVRVDFIQRCEHHSRAIQIHACALTPALLNRANSI